MVLAVVAGWELRHYSAVSAGANGNFGVYRDPGRAGAGAGRRHRPRAAPAAGRGQGRRPAGRARRRLTAALASWQISRQPIRQGGAALLIVLAVATGTLALAQRQSWTRSDHDQAAFSSGADVRVETSQPLSAAQVTALARPPGVRHAMPVAAFAETADRERGDPRGRLEPGGGRDAAPRRPVAAAAARLFGTIVPACPPPGATLPGRPSGLPPHRAARPRVLGLAPATVSVSVEDADGNVYQLDAGALPADGRPHTLTVSLEPPRPGRPGQRGRGREAIYPLRLTGVSLEYTLPATGPRVPASFTVDGVSGGPGTAPVAGAALRGWLPSPRPPNWPASARPSARSARPACPHVSTAAWPRPRWR